MLPMTRRMFAGGLAASALGYCAGAAQASEILKFNGPLKIYSGFPVGGQSDLLARLLADKLKDRIGRPVVVENKTGAGGRIAIEAVKNLPPDGSSLVVANISHMGIAKLTLPDLPYDPVKDFTAITKAVDYQLALVTGPLTGAKDFKSLVDWLKANPDKANSGLPALASISHVYDSTLIEALGLKVQQIGYRGSTPIATALLQKEVAMGWAGIADYIQQHRAGTLSIVAVSGAKRSAELPDVPTFPEHGVPQLGPNGWIGLFAPPNLPDEITTLYNRELVAILREPEMEKKLQPFGFLITATSSAEMKTQVETDLVKWRPVVDKAGIKP